MSESTEPRPRRPYVLALGFLAASWIAVRFVATPSGPPRAAVDAFDGIQVVASATAGRLELRGWPAALADLELDTWPDVRTGATRLAGRVESANESLAALAATVARRVERLPGGPVGLRAGGLLIVFEGEDGARLASLAGAPPSRARDNLLRMAALLETRLEEPLVLDEIEAATRQRELMSLERQIRDAIEVTDVRMQDEAERFRRDALESIRKGGGVFLRHGRGVLLEVVLAAALGVLLREALRRPRGGVPFLVSACVGPMAAIGLVTALAGGPLLPIHPLFGLSVRFVPLSFAIGWLAPTILEASLRLDRRGAPKAAVRPPAALPPQRSPESRIAAGARLGARGEVPPSPEDAPRPAAEGSTTGAPPAGPAPPLVSGTLPFFPKRRRR